MPTKLHDELLRFAELLEGRGIEAKLVERPGSPLMLVAKPGGKVHVRLSAPSRGFVIEVDRGRGTPRVEAEFAETLGGAERVFAEWVGKYRVVRQNPASASKDAVARMRAMASIPGIKLIGAGRTSTELVGAVGNNEIDFSYYPGQSTKWVEDSEIGTYLRSKPNRGSFVIEIDPVKGKARRYRFRDYEEAEAFFLRSWQLLGGKAPKLTERRYPTHKGEKLPLPNPSRPRFTTQDAAAALKKLGLHPRTYGAKELARGMNIEIEHRDVTRGDPTATAMIALAHLRERADYYEVLERAESAPRSNPTNAKALQRKVQRALTPELLKARYRAANAKNPMYGHCYAASEALYHLLGGKASGYKPVRAKDDAGVVHWWLVGPDGKRIDATADQYLCVGKTPPYAHGRAGGFLTKLPSKRAQTIMARVRAKR